MNEQNKRRQAGAVGVALHARYELAREVADVFALAEGFDGQTLTKFDVDALRRRVKARAKDLDKALRAVIEESPQEEDFWEWAEREAAKETT